MESPYRTVYLDPDFRRDPKTNCFCCVCQKDIKGGPRFFARLLDHGITAGHPEDEHMVPEGLEHDLGTHPVGNECARRIGREWFKSKPHAPGTAPSP